MPTVALQSYIPLLIQAQRQANADWVSGHLLPLVLAAWQQAVMAQQDDQAAVAPTKRVASDSVLRAWQYICHHHHEAWSLARMAQQADLARTQFSAQIIALTGSSPIQALNRERLAAACEDLIHTDDSITDIALRRGFQSARYFTRLFRQHTQQTPSAFRDNGRQLAQGYDGTGESWTVQR